MDERQRLRERIIATYWEIHHDRNCGQCDQDTPDEEELAGETPEATAPVDLQPGPADDGL